MTESAKAATGAANGGEAAAALQMAIESRSEAKAECERRRSEVLAKHWPVLAALDDDTLKKHVRHVTDSAGFSGIYDCVTLSDKLTKAAAMLVPTKPSETSKDDAHLPPAPASPVLDRTGSLADWRAKLEEALEQARERPADEGAAPRSTFDDLLQAIRQYEEAHRRREEAKAAVEQRSTDYLRVLLRCLITQPAEAVWTRIEDNWPHQGDGSYRSYVVNMETLCNVLVPATVADPAAPAADQARE